MEPLHVSIEPSSSTSATPGVTYEQVDYREIEFPNFQHLKRLGRGSYGTVIQGFFRDKAVAVKLVETNIDRVHIHNEAKVLHSFKHENIIKLFAAFHGEQSGLILEIMEGGSLHELLHQNRHLQYYACHVIGWSQQVLAALDYLHQNNYVHRDLKPSNMLLTNDYITLKLCDFGTATELRSSMTNNRGSAAWMAPEVFRGKKYDQKCDIFSFGIFLWEMISRRQPFVETDGHAYRILWQVASEGRRPNPIIGCPDVMTDLMRRCWSDTPDERPVMEEIITIIDIMCTVYPNRYLPIIDRTTNRQAFAQTLPQRVNFTPYPTTSRSPALNRPPIPPPPRISGFTPSHYRTGSHDNSRAGTSAYENPVPYRGQTVDYNPLTSNHNGMPYNPCIQLPPPAYMPPSPNNNTLVTGEIGWRRSSEPPLSDSDSGYGTRVERKKKGFDLRQRNGDRLRNRPPMGFLKPCNFLKFAINL